MDGIVIICQPPSKRIFDANNCVIAVHNNSMASGAMIDIVQ